METLFHRLLDPIGVFLDPASDRYWPFLASAAAIALVIYVARRIGPLTPAGFVRWLCPRAVYLHPSARLDVAMFIVNTVIVAVPTVTVTVTLAHGVRQGLGSLVGLTTLNIAPSLGLSVLFTLCLLAAGDLALFLGHYAMHKSRILWEFHKVHHSATVLMPLTAYRQHPVEEFITGSLNAAALGLVGGVFLYAAPAANVLGVQGHNLIELIALIAARHLRHSHIAVSFGALERFFVSPAQHQLHHSTAREHFDRNFGVVLAIWDWMFGTLVLATPNQAISFGIDGYAEHEYTSLAQLYLLPFRNAFAIARAALSPPAITTVTR
jgi:sterol desaturase/sphingolipid hydroxylase (fatty acid hydroxylase superfamily)